MTKVVEQYKKAADLLRKNYWSREPAYLFFSFSDILITFET